MEIMIVLGVLVALVFMVHAWRATLVVVTFFATVLVGLGALGSLMPERTVSASVKDTFCSMPYESRRMSYLVVMGEAKRQEFARMSANERNSMWRLIGARVGCAF